MERADTSLTKETIKDIKELAAVEGHSQASMIRKLVIEAIAARKNVCKHEFVTEDLPGRMLHGQNTVAAVCRLCGYRP